MTHVCHYIIRIFQTHSHFYLLVIPFHFGQLVFYRHKRLNLRLEMIYSMSRICSVCNRFEKKIKQFQNANVFMHDGMYISKKSFFILTIERCRLNQYLKKIVFISMNVLYLIAANWFIRTTNLQFIGSNRSIKPI